MKLISKYIGEAVYLELLGKKEISGFLIDFGKDVLVLFKEDEFYYIPLSHIREMRSLSKEEADLIIQPETGIIPPLTQTLSLKEILLAAAKGWIVELNVAGSQLFHGYITHVMNDYIVFFSPVYQMMLIPFQHIKWIAPYPADSRPYGFKHPMFEGSASADETFAPTLNSQIKALKGTFITCNIGDREIASGKLLHKEADFIELLTEKEQHVHLNLYHIKGVAYM